MVERLLTQAVVSAAMREAGVAVLDEFAGSASAWEMAEAVYIAMERQRAGEASQ